MAPSGGKMFYGWIVLAAAALAYFVAFGILMYPFGVFLPFICKEFSWSRGAVAGAFTVLMVVGGLVSPLVGMFIAKFGARRAIVLGNVLGGLGLLLLAYHSQIWQFYVGYGALIGLGVGLGGIIATTTLANNWFSKKKPLAIGVIMASGGIGGFVMIPVIMELINSVGWRSTFMVLFALVLLFGVVLPGLLIRNRPEELGQVPDGGAGSEPVRKDKGVSRKKLYSTPIDFTTRETMRTGAFWLLIVFSITVMFALSTVVTHQVAFLVDMGIATGIAATALGFLTGMSAIGKLGIGFLALRYNMWPLGIAFLVIMTIGMALILLTKSTPMVFVYTIILGIGYGGVSVATMSLFPIYFGRTNYSKIIGFALPFSTIIGSTGALIAGAIYDVTKSYTLSFILGVISLIIGLISVTLAQPPVHPSLKESVRA